MTHSLPSDGHCLAICFDLSARCLSKLLRLDRLDPLGPLDRRGGQWQLPDSRVSDDEPSGGLKIATKLKRVRNKLEDGMH